MDINEIHSFHGAFDLSNVGKSQSFLMLELTLLSLSGCLVELCESVLGQAMDENGSMPIFRKIDGVPFPAFSRVKLRGLRAKLLCTSIPPIIDS